MATTKVTAKLRVVKRSEIDEGESRQTWVSLQANYDDYDKNKEWSLFTPSMNVEAMFKGAVGDSFSEGAEFLVTFEKE